MSIANYWNLLPDQQTDIKDSAKTAYEQANLEAYLKENRLVLHPKTGMPIQPEDYPCRCNYTDANDCYNDKQGTEYESGTCYCPCHTYEW